MRFSMSLTPLLVVEDVPGASRWLQRVFGLQSFHGGPQFDMLGDAAGKIVIWLRVLNPASEAARPEPDLIGAGRGVTFYIQVDDLEAAQARAGEAGGTILEEVHHSSVARHREFTIEGPHGYAFAAHTAYEGDSTAG